MKGTRRNVAAIDAFGRNDLSRRVCALPAGPSRNFHARLGRLGRDVHEGASDLTVCGGDVNVIYIHTWEAFMVLVDKIDEIGKPAWIALIVLGFMAWWPVGLLALAFFLGSGRMGCAYRNGGNWQSHWQSKVERMQNKVDRMRSKMEGRDWWGTSPSSGNRAFDDYRTETLRRLEDEQREFKEFLERLRFAKDRSEFDQFMDERRNRPRDVTPPPQPQA
jgi:hypothetical protein